MMSDPQAGTAGWGRRQQCLRGITYLIMWQSLTVAIAKLWRRKWQPTPVFLPGKSHGLRILVGYSPWGCKEPDTTEWFHFTHIAKLHPNAMLSILPGFQHSFLLLHNQNHIWWLKALSVYYLSTSGVKSPEHGLTWFSAQGLTRLQSRYQPGCILIRGLAGEETAFTFPKLVDRTDWIHFLVVVGLKVTFFFVARIRVCCWMFWLQGGLLPITWLGQEWPGWSPFWWNKFYWLETLLTSAKFLHLNWFLFIRNGLPRWLSVEHLPVNVGGTRDAGSISGLRRCPGVGNGKQFQYSHLKNSMDRGVWWATVHGVAKSWTWLNNWANHIYCNRNKS